MSRRCLAIGVAALLAALLLPPTTSEAVRTTHAVSPRSTFVHFRVTAPPPLAIAPVCGPAGCLFPNALPSVTFAGDFTGTGVNAGAGAIGNGSITTVSLSTFGGSVRSCGTGTVVLRMIGRFRHGLASPGHGDWRVIHGVGTAGLASLHGGGHFRYVVHPDNSATSTWSGRIRC